MRVLTYFLQKCTDVFTGLVGSISVYNPSKRSLVDFRFSWLRTGDLVKFNRNEELIIIDRIKVLFHHFQPVTWLSKCWFSTGNDKSVSSSYCVHYFPFDRQLRIWKDSRVSSCSCWARGLLARSPIRPGRMCCGIPPHNQWRSSFRIHHSYRGRDATFTGVGQTSPSTSKCFILWRKLLPSLKHIPSLPAYICLQSTIQTHSPFWDSQFNTENAEREASSPWAA